MRSRGEDGFTLIESILGIAVMAIIVVTISQLFVANLRSVTFGKARALGLAIANQQMEYLRNLPYDQVATRFGNIYPPGTISDDQTITMNNFRFRVHTQIAYVDDTYDGIESGPSGGKPQDFYPYDYKKADITIYQVTNGGRQVAKLSTLIGAKAAETSSNTGILSIKVVDANGNPIANANVSITNATQTPNVNINTTTDNQGLVVIPKLPPDSTNHYHVTATLPGYSSDGTLLDPPGAQTAVKQDLNVLAQQITSLTLAIDHTATLNIHVQDTSGNPVAGTAITTSGLKQIYANPAVAKYSAATTTDAGGNIALSSMEWDGYKFAVASGKYLVSASPYSPVTLNAGASLAVTLTLSNSSSYPRITTVTPVSDTNDATPTTIKVTGVNLPSGSTITLTMAGQPNIVATSVVSSGGSTLLTGSLNLNNVATGAWNLIVTTSSGTVTEPGGFVVTAP